MLKNFNLVKFLCKIFIRGIICGECQKQRCDILSITLLFRSTQQYTSLNQEPDALTEINNRLLHRWTLQPFLTQSMMGTHQQQKAVAETETNMAQALQYPRKDMPLRLSHRSFNVFV